MNKNLSRSMSHASRASKKSLHTEPVEPMPLTREQHETQRRAEEAATRAENKRLNDEWAAHNNKVRELDIAKPKPLV